MEFSGTVPWHMEAGFIWPIHPRQLMDPVGFRELWVALDSLLHGPNKALLTSKKIVGLWIRPGPCGLSPPVVLTISFGLQRKMRENYERDERKLKCCWRATKSELNSAWISATKDLVCGGKGGKMSAFFCPNRPCVHFGGLPVQLELLLTEQVVAVARRNSA